MALASSSTTPLRLLSTSHLRRWQSGGTILKVATISTPRTPPLSSVSLLHQLKHKIPSRQFSTSSSKSFNQSTNKMAPSTQALIEVAKNRRTYYHLGRNSPVPDSEIIELVNQAILHIPSSFNTQSTRIVVALHGDHEKVWNIAIDAFKPLVSTGAVPQEVFDNQTKPKLEAFKAAYGTILFYEDPTHIKPYAEKFPAFGSKFPEWADHTNAMHQWFLWAGLESLGFGANLQHYNPLIDADLAKTFNIPTDWVSKAQLVFGSIESPAGEKQFKPVEERVKVFGAQ
ncbi:nitroreductase family protein, putative [Talaromyces stipitatus ATCC 10500]|uniref:Nitroreductase family protein, putative n=1 Tax=Talaromyces stipitatus (strain ATCC 10500 / CBS 375.48 / QM 6759 / NRRL 1006) TaxID=441959 RepID=B8MKT3_TALSN|nr:nitroreductase family protein, putative [Talaromyces stipitatus ATCC 10500]EED14932.1 nitroreductase family protein, putative [Talaromyces stipitatus ATCC 10500]